MTTNLINQFGNIDIYLFDQLLKGSYADCKSVLDVGCGSGRNIVYFLKNGFKVYGVDPDLEHIEAVQRLAETFQPKSAKARFKVAVAERLPFNNSQFDLVISSAVLHFAKNEAHFEQMLFSMWRVLKPGGYFFSRIASAIGMEDLAMSLGNGRYLLPDESERFLVTHEMLMYYTKKFNAVLYEPIKTTNVQNLRCMTTWCLIKS